MKYVQAQKFKLSGSGVTSTATTIVLTSMKLPDNATNISMTDFGTTGFATIEPGTSKEEQVSFTGISIDPDTDVATLTGVTRGLRFVSPYDSVTANKFSHAGGSMFVLSNTAGFYGGLSAEKPTISSGIVAPSSTPSKVGDVYVDTVAKKIYFATGTASSADWTITN